MFKLYNANPSNKRVGDCVIRAISKALDKPWEEVYVNLCIKGFMLSDLPSSNAVWGAFLKQNGFRRDVVSDECHECYTVADFCREHPDGTYVIGTGSHAVTVKDGCYYDTWDSGNETPIYFYKKGI